MKKWWRTHRPTARRLTQLYAALLYNANIKGFIEGRIFTGNTKAVCVPGLNCYSCPGAVGACPLGSLQNALNASGHTAPWYMLGILMLYGVIFGRTICGWLCPAGLMQELLHKIPTPKIRKGKVTRGLSYLKYILLAVLVIIIPTWYGIRYGKALPAFCKYVCPAGTLEGAVGLLSNARNSTSFYQLKALFTNKFVIMTLVGLLCVFCCRAFCRFLCPLGAIYSLFNRSALIGVKVNLDRCSGCGACVRRCPMDVRSVGDHECISCGKCMDVCAQGAISLKCGKITPKGPEIGKNADPEPVIQRRKRTGRIAWGVAFAALAVLLAGQNLVNPPKTVQEPAPIAESAANPSAEKTDTVTPAPLTVGANVGDQLPDFTTDLIGGGEFTLSDYRGKVVMINLWATFCAPCVEELPYFEQLKIAHPDVEILAIHHLTGAKKAEKFLADKGWEHLAFAVDSKDKGLFELVNGSEAMPQTIVLNPQGAVVYNAQASVTCEQLEALYKKAAAE